MKPSDFELKSGTVLITKNPEALTNAVLLDKIKVNMGGEVNVQVYRVLSDFGNLMNYSLSQLDNNYEVPDWYVEHVYMSELADIALDSPNNPLSISNRLDQQIESLTKIRDNLLRGEYHV